MKEFIVRLIQLAIAKLTPADTKTAQELVKAYRAKNGGSNRTNWEQVTSVLSAVLAVIRTGKAVEVTAFYADQVGGKSPAYNLVHRQLSAGVIRPYWDRVQVVALSDSRNIPGGIEGTPSTTVRMGPGVRLFIAPVGK